MLQLAAGTRLLTPHPHTNTRTRTQPSLSPRDYNPETSEWGWSKPPPPSSKSGERGDAVKKLRKKVGVWIRVCWLKQARWLGAFGSLLLCMRDSPKPCSCDLLEGGPFSCPC